MALSGKIFAITGTLSCLRVEFESKLESNGGQVEKSLTKNVTHLIVGSCNKKKGKYSSKEEKARKNGVTIISEETVESMIANPEVPSAAAKAAALAAAEVIDVDADDDDDDENKPPPLKKQKKETTSTSNGGIWELAHDSKEVK